jgi:hypothetical protein
MICAEKRTNTHPQPASTANNNLRRAAGKAAVMTQTDDSRKRPMWCGLVDRAVQDAVLSGRPFAVEELLNGIGIFRWSPYRERAVTYAKKIIGAGSSGGSHDDAEL